MLVFKKGHKHPGLKKIEVHLGYTKVEEQPSIHGQMWKSARQPIAFFAKRMSAIPQITVAPLFVTRKELLKEGWEFVQLSKGIEVLMTWEEVVLAEEGVIHEKMMREVHWHGLFKEKFEHPLKKQLKLELLKKFE